jgi:hypothetical protein
MITSGNRYAGLSRAKRALAALGDLCSQGGALARTWKLASPAGVRPDFSYEPIPAYPGPLLPQDRLVFAHIEKTAGSTAYHVLAQNFREEEICPHRFGNLGYWGPERLAPYRFFALHAPVRILRMIPPPAKFLTFLREPVARLLSHYNFWRSLNDQVVDQEGLDHIRFLKGMPLKELLTPSPLAIMPEFWNLAAQRLAGDLFIAPSGQPWRGENELVDVALENLTNFNALGLTEFPDLSFQCIAEDLGIPNRYGGDRINVTADNTELHPERYDPVRQSDLDDETLESIERATRLDRQVYEAGEQLFRDRLRRGLILSAFVPPHLRTEPLEGSEMVIGDHHSGAVLYGPYCVLPAGKYRATFWVQATPPSSRQKPWSIDLDVCSGRAGQVHARRSIHRVELADRWFEPVEIEFSLASRSESVEIRLHTSGVASLAVRRGVGLRRL